MKQEILGNFLGEGKSRKVYNYIPDPTYVVKCNKSVDEDTNLREYNTYLYFKKLNLDHMLSPCRYENNFFIMKKVLPVPFGNYNIPIYFSDQVRNWGILDNSLVRIDYAWNIVGTDEKYIILKDENIKFLRKMPNIQLENISANEIKILINESTLTMLTKHTHLMQVT